MKCNIFNRRSEARVQKTTHVLSRTIKTRVCGCGRVGVPVGGCGCGVGIFGVGVGWVSFGVGVGGRRAAGRRVGACVCENASVAVGPGVGASRRGSGFWRVGRVRSWAVVWA